MNQRRRVILLGALVGSALTAAGAFGGGRLGPDRPNQWRVTPAESAIAKGLLAPQAVEALASAGGRSAVTVVGERADRRFYMAGGSGATRCYMHGRAVARDADFSIIACVDGASFPSDRQPVLDLSAYRGEPPPSTSLFVQHLTGFAADDIAEVGVVSASGMRLTTPVANNVYATNRVPSEAVVKIFAVDVNGKVVWSRPLGGPPAPPVG